VATALKYNGVCAIILSASLLFIFVTALVSNGLIVSSVTLSNYGTISSAPTYQISQVNGIIKVTNAASGSTVYSGTSANDAFFAAFGYVRNGGIVNVLSGTYIAQGTYPRIIMQNCVNVIVNFDPASLITIAPNMNDNIFFMQNCTGCVLNGARIDGNAAQETTTGISGWGICLYDSSYCSITNANIQNCRLGDIGIFGTTSATSHHNTLDHNTLGACGWNCITAWGQYTTITNNDCSHASDVGISSYGTGNIIDSNYCHDMDGTTGDQNSHYGIAVENEGFCKVTNNVVSNCVGAWAVGIVVGTGGVTSNNIVKDNLVTNCNCGINIYNTSGDVITQNQVTNWGSSSGAAGLWLSHTTNAIANFNTFETSSTSAALGAPIFLQGTSNNAVCNNIVIVPTSPSYKAVYLSSSANNNLITANTLTAKTGIQIADSTCNGNRVYGNSYVCTTNLSNGGSGTITTKPSTSILTICCPSLYGTISPTQGTYQQSNSSQVTINLTPNSGYTATLVVDGTAVVLTNNAYTVTMSSDHLIYAVFTKN
jgi:hypothetical protein